MTEDGILLNQRTARIELHHAAKSEVSKDYLSYVLNASVVREQVISSSRGSTVFHTSPTRLLAARWPLPPLAEQRTILDHLREVERLHGDAAARLNAEIQLIREYRTRLIADVVTGKLDVREAATALPDEPEEAVAADDTEVLVEGEDIEDAALGAVEAEVGA